MGKSAVPRFIDFKVVSIDDLREDELDAAEIEDASDGWNYGYITDYPPDIAHCDSELCREPRNGPFLEVDGFLICQTCFVQEFGDDDGEPFFVLLRDDS